MARRVSSPLLVGRDEDLASAGEVLARAEAHEPTTLLIGGQAGMGKSRLLAEVVGRAGDLGFTVLSGACVDLGEGSPPFAPITDAVRRLRRSAGDDRISAALGPDADELAALVPGLRPGGDRTSQAAPGRVFEAVLELLEGLAEQAPVLLTVEDAHWADASTRHLLAFLARTLLDSRVAVAVTFRTDELHRRHPLRALVAELERQRGVVRLDLRPLRRDEMAAQLHAISGGPVDADRLQSIWQRSEGNPFYAEELVLADECCNDVPASVRDGTLARIGLLPGPHQALLRVAAAVGRDVSDALLLELTELPRDEFHEILRELVDRSLLVLDGDGYRFGHALLQEVIYDELLPGERVRLHTRIAEQLASSDPPPDDASAWSELAHRWHKASRLPEALVASVRAGVATLAVGAADEALGHLQRALELWEALPEAAELSPLPKVEVLAAAGNAAGAMGQFALGVAFSRQAVELADQGDDNERAALLHQQLAHLLFIADQPGAVEEYERGVALVPPEPLTRARACVLAGHARVLLLIGEIGRSRQLAEEAIAAAIAVRDRQTEGFARCTYATALANQGDDRCWEEFRLALDIAREVNDPDDIGRAYVNLTHALAEHGRWDELLEAGAEGLAVARRLGIDRTHGVYVETNVLNGLVSLGRWDDAVAAQRSLAARLPEGHWDYFAIDALRVDRGSFDEVEAAIEAAGPLPAHDTAVLQAISYVYEARVGLAVWKRRPDEVAPLVEDYLARMPRSMIGWNVAPALWRAIWAQADRAELARARHDDAVVDHARQLAERWLRVLDDALVQRPGEERVHPVVGFDGYVALAHAECERLDGRDSAGAWVAAADRFDELRTVFPAAYARFRAAEAHLRDGDRATAAEAATASAAAARALGAAPLLELVEQLIARGRLAPAAASGNGHDAADDDGLGLSPREREVLLLVAAGRTNRQIAEELFISPKTASVHVSNILAKLGVAGRVEAAAVAHRAGLTA